MRLHTFQKGHDGTVSVGDDYVGSHLRGRGAPSDERGTERPGAWLIEDADEGDRGRQRRSAENVLAPQQGELQRAVDHTRICRPGLAGPAAVDDTSDRSGEAGSDVQTDILEYLERRPVKQDSALLVDREQFGGRTVEGRWRRVALVERGGTAVVSPATGEVDEFEAKRSALLGGCHDSQFEIQAVVEAVGHNAVEYLQIAESDRLAVADCFLRCTRELLDGIGDWDDRRIVDRVIGEVRMGVSVDDDATAVSFQEHFGHFAEPRPE